MVQAQSFWIPCNVDEIFVLIKPMLSVGKIAFRCSPALKRENFKIRNL